MSNMNLRVVIMGACGNSGRALAEALSARGATLILSDHDAAALSQLARELGAKGIFCDIVSVSSIEIFAAEIARNWSPVDVLINAAGSGYERTLGMHRVSRALMPVLRQGRGSKWIINVPPSKGGEPSTIFSYASSEDAFARLSEAIAQEAHGSGVNVGIACPSLNTIKQAGNWSPDKVSPIGEPEQLAAFGRRVATLLLACEKREVRAIRGS